jgi:hypothetical protein
MMNVVYDVKRTVCDVKKTVCGVKKTVCDVKKIAYDVKKSVGVWIIFLVFVIVCAFDVSLELKLFFALGIWMIFYIQQQMHRMVTLR